MFHFRTLEYTAQLIVGKLSTKDNINFREILSALYLLLKNLRYLFIQIPQILKLLDNRPSTGRYSEVEE